MTYDPEDLELDSDGPDCTWCGGDGTFIGTETPGFRYGWDDPDAVHECPACHGSGDRDDQVLF